MQTIFSNRIRSTIVISLIIIMGCAIIGLKYANQKQVALGNYEVPTFEESKKYTYDDEHMSIISYVVRNDRYHEYIKLSYFPKQKTSPDMTLADVKRMADAGKIIAHKLAKEIPSPPNIVDAYSVSPQKYFNCNGYCSYVRTHHENNVTSQKTFFFAQRGELYTLRLQVTFQDKSIESNPVFKKRMHDAWKKIVAGTRNTCEG